MKKLLLVATMVLGMYGMSLAQYNTATNSANLQLQVLAAMQMSVSGSLDFGMVAQGVAATPTIAVGSGAKFDVSGTDSASFEITLPTSTVLTNISDASTISFTPVLKCSADGTTAGSAAADNTPYTLGVPSSSKPGHYYFLLGGSVSVTTSTTAGVYKGTYTLTATYN